MAVGAKPIDAYALARVCESLDSLFEKQTASSVQIGNQYQPGMTAYLQRWHEIRFGHALVVPLDAPLSEQVALTFLIDHVPLGTFQLGKTDLEPPSTFSLESQKALFDQLHDERYIREPLPPRGTYLKHRISHFNALHRAAGHESPFRTIRLKAALKHLKKHINAARGDVPPADRSYRSYLPPALDDASFDALIRTCFNDRIGARDKALLHLVRQVGIMGASSVRLLQVEHLRMVEADVMQIDLEGAGIRPLNGKVKPLNPFLTGPALDAMTSWLKMLDKVRGPVFINHSRGFKPAQGRAITVNTIDVMLQSRSKLAGIPKTAFRALPSPTAPAAQPGAAPISPTEMPVTLDTAEVRGSAPAAIFVVRENVSAVFPGFVSAQFSHIVVKGILDASAVIVLPGFDANFELGRLYFDGSFLVQHGADLAVNLAPFGSREIAAIAAYFGIPDAFDFHRSTADELIARVLDSPSADALRNACCEHAEFCEAQRAPIYVRLLAPDAARYSSHP
jgi:hypothetical protein